MNWIRPNNISSAIFIGVALAMFVFPDRSLARLYYPDSHAIISVDGKLLLVMVVSKPLEEDKGRLFALPSGGNVDLRERFASNGVYRLDTFECIQSLDWFTDKEELYASGDLTSLARLNKFAVGAVGKTNGWALKFYKDGKEIRRYEVADLVDIPNALFLPYTSDGWRSEWFDLATQTNDHQLLLTTAPQDLSYYGHKLHLATGNSFLFDLNTGDILREELKHAKALFSIAVILVLTVIICLMILCIKGVQKLFGRRMTS